MKYNGWVLIPLALIIVSCSTQERDVPTLELGLEFTDKTVRLIEIDTFEVKSDTFKFDSLISSDGNRLLVGRYLDPYYGTVKIESFMELAATHYRLPEDATLDSMALILGYDRYFYNDTLALCQLGIHRLLEDFETGEDHFYNTSSLRYDTVPMATKSFYPQPLGEDSLHISIPRSQGEHLFDMIRRKSISTDDEFTDRFKGIVLRPLPGSNAAVIGFTKNAQRTLLRFYYSIPQEFDEEEDLFLDFMIKPAYGSKAFNRIKSDVTGLALAALTDQEINLSSGDGGDMTFMQSGSGYVTRVEFPTLKNIGDLPGTGTVLDAVLILVPVLDSYDEFIRLGDSLHVQVVDQNNDISSVLNNGKGPVYGRFGPHDREFDEPHYRIPVTAYVEQEFLEVPHIDNGLILSPNDFRNSIDRVVLYGAGSKDYAPKLIITYAIYDE